MVEHHVDCLPLHFLPLFRILRAQETVHERKGRLQPERRAQFEIKDCCGKRDDGQRLAALPYAHLGTIDARLRLGRGAFYEKDDAKCLQMLR